LEACLIHALQEELLEFSLAKKITGILAANVHVESPLKKAAKII